MLWGPQFFWSLFFVAIETFWLPQKGGVSFVFKKIPLSFSKNMAHLFFVDKKYSITIG
jgi:hypothetical protein